MENLKTACFNLHWEAEQKHAQTEIKKIFEIHGSGKIAAVDGNSIEIVDASYDAIEEIAQLGCVKTFGIA